jgi:hypothetical protein
MSSTHPNNAFTTQPKCLVGSDQGHRRSELEISAGMGERIFAEQNDIVKALAARTDRHVVAPASE